MTDHPSEHASLDHFIAKVEAAGEDKKHASITSDLDEAIHALRNARDRAESIEFGILNRAVAYLISARAKLDDSPLYEQEELDAAVAEAVAKERERILKLVLDLENSAAERNKATMRGFGGMVHEISFPSKDAP